MQDVTSAGTPLYDDKGNVRAVMMTEREYESLARKYSDYAKKPPVPAGGPGTELKGLLSMVGIKASPNCSCNARAQKMDEMGVEWCRQNTTEIVGWLQQEAERRKLPFSRFAARKLVQTAIARAERKRPKTAPAGA
jgi:hypothetical protein